MKPKRGISEQKWKIVWEREKESELNDKRFLARNSAIINSFDLPKQRTIKIYE